MRLAARLGLAAASGLLLAASFPPLDVWWLAVPALAALLVAVRGAGPLAGSAAGLVHGLAFFLVLLGWMRVIGADAWIALAALQAVFLAGFGAGAALVGRAPGWPVWTAALWVAQEGLRARVPFGGFPWGRLAFGQTDGPLLGWAVVGGAPLVSFAAVLLAGCLVVLVAPRSRLVIRSAGVAVAAATLAAGPVLVRSGGAPAGPPVVVAVVQGNVPRAGLDFQGQRAAVLRNHVDATHALAAEVRSGRVPAPVLVLWPENASDLDPFRDAEAYALIGAAVRDVGVPVLVGLVVEGPDADHVQNVGVVWDPVRGPGARYVKRHPVPFGEYIPLRGALSGVVSRLERIPRDFAPGDRPGVLDAGGLRLGDVICFEVAYDGLVRDVVTGGAGVLVVQTNNATSGRTGQPEQQLAMSRLRAVEHHRPVLIAATSGISAVIDARGSVRQRTEEFTQAVLAASVGPGGGRSPADATGDLVELLLATLGVGAVALALAAGRVRGG